MAACCFGASGFRTSILNFSYSGPKFSSLQPLHGLSIRNQKYIQVDRLEISRRPKRALIGCQCSTSEAITEKSDDCPEDATRSPSAVEALVTEICDTTSIAEVELKLGGFRLYVRRDLTQETTTFPSPVSASVSVNTAVELPNANGSASSTSLAISKSSQFPSDSQTLFDKAADEGIAILQSPRVGYFRRSRTIKGKRAPPACKEKQQVKEGQVLCYIEQLGGDIPIESDVSGEVIKMLQEDGEPVGYGDALIAILPSFPGIKKL